MKFHWFRRQQREEELDAKIHSHPDEAIRCRNRAPVAHWVTHLTD
jgi:hypothetical protein